MFAAKPIVAIREFGQEQSSLLHIVLDKCLLMKYNLDLMPDNEKLKQVAALLKENTEVTFSTINVAIVLRLYPEARTKLALFGLDTETEGLVLDAFAHLLLGTTWPTGGDNLTNSEHVTWRLLFQRQAKAAGLGYVV